MLARLYTKTTLQASADIKHISQNAVMGRFLPVIEASTGDKKPLDILEIGLATAMDFITAYCSVFTIVPDFCRIRRPVSDGTWHIKAQKDIASGLWSSQI